jgi:anti-sigma factor RsiW
MTCPSQEELVAVLDGALAPGALAGARRHVEGCAACRGELARLEAAVSALRAGSPAPEPSPFFSTRLAARIASLPPRRRAGGLLRAVPWRPVLAGGLAVALAVGAVLVQRGRTAEELAVAARLDLLQDLEVVASVGDVETTEDAEVVAALDRLGPGDGRR